jgi:sulfate transport system ATP-binding protein
VEQAGAPDVLYDRPASPFVVRFFGEANHLPVRRLQGRLELVGAANGSGDTVVGLVRPRDITLSLTWADGALPVTLGRARRTGPRVRLALHDAHAATIDADLSYERFQELGLQPGEQAFILPRNVHIFDAAPDIGGMASREPALAH